MIERYHEKISVLTIREVNQQKRNFRGSALDTQNARFILFRNFVAAGATGQYPQGAQDPGYTLFKISRNTLIYGIPVYLVLLLCCTTNLAIFR